jgi:hypothetical protein
LQALQAKSGFLDIDRIERTLWPALSLDLDSGENSVITSAFGNDFTFSVFFLSSLFDSDLNESTVHYNWIISLTVL